MKAAGRQVGWVFAVAGAIVMADTSFLFYQLRESQLRSEAFSFTVGFVLFQEFLLFGSLVYVSLSAGRSSTPVPVRIGYVTVILFCFIIALITILVFNLFLLPRYASSHTYYTILIARTGLAILMLGLIHVVGIVQRGAHRESELKRARVEELVTACDRIRAVCGIHGWQIEQSCSRLGEQIRFCEGLRRNQLLMDEMATKVGQLEALVQTQKQNGESAQAMQLVKEIAILASRRS